MNLGKPPNFAKHEDRSKSLIYAAFTHYRSKKQLIQGTQELELKYNNEIRFKDKLICIIL